MKKHRPPFLHYGDPPKTVKEQMLHYQRRREDRVFWTGVALFSLAAFALGMGVCNLLVIFGAG